MNNDDRVNELVVFLSNPNRHAEEHVETVMDMVRELSRYKHELAETRQAASDLRHMMKEDKEPWLREDGYVRPRDPARVLVLPVGARSVKVEL